MVNNQTAKIGEEKENAAFFPLNSKGVHLTAMRGMGKLPRLLVSGASCLLFRDPLRMLVSPAF